MNSTIPIFDGHNDVLLNLLLPERGGGRSFFERGERGHLDLPRAVEGGFGGGFFACFVPPGPADGWSLEAAVTVGEDGYEVEMAPSVDASYARRFMLDTTVCAVMLIGKRVEFNKQRSVRGLRRKSPPEHRI